MKAIDIIGVVIGNLISWIILLGLVFINLIYGSLITTLWFANLILILIIGVELHGTN